jgi:hypothetical protein
MLFSQRKLTPSRRTCTFPPEFIHREIPSSFRVHRLTSIPPLETRDLRSRKVMLFPASSGV